MGVCVCVGVCVLVATGCFGGPALPSPLLLPQDSTLSEDSPPPSASPRLPGPTATKCSYPYHTLSQSSDEVSPEGGGCEVGVSPPSRLWGPPVNAQPPVPSSWMSPLARPRAGRASRWDSGWRASTWSSTWRSSWPTASMVHGSCTLMVPSSRYGAGGGLFCWGTRGSRHPNRLSCRARGSRYLNRGLHVAAPGGF